ncbi:MAG: CvpA family protein [Candidatus Omnitrophica bacterium]|nr:CvpA family protein [Candidatus Omnitrophota bacterium]
MEAVGTFGLIDFCLLILFLRIIYSAVSRGIISEGFKAIGLFAGTTIAFHFYPVFSATPSGKFLFLDKRQLDCIVFLSILLSVTLVFSLLRKIIMLLFQAKEFSSSQRWLSLIIGGLRFSLLASVIIFILHTASSQPESLERSLSYRLFKDIAPRAHATSLGAAKVFLSYFFKK